MSRKSGSGAFRWKVIVRAAVFVTIPRERSHRFGVVAHARPPRMPSQNQPRHGALWSSRSFERSFDCAAEVVRLNELACGVVDTRAKLERVGSAAVADGWKRGGEIGHEFARRHCRPHVGKSKSPSLVRINACQSRVFIRDRGVDRVELVCQRTSACHRGEPASMSRQRHIACRHRAQVLPVDSRSAPSERPCRLPHRSGRPCRRGRRSPKRSRRLQQGRSGCRRLGYSYPPELGSILETVPSRLFATHTAPDPTATAVGSLPTLTVGSTVPGAGIDSGHAVPTAAHNPDEAETHRDRVRPCRYSESSAVTCASQAKTRSPSDQSS